MAATTSTLLGITSSISLPPSRISFSASFPSNSCFNSITKPHPPLIHSTISACLPSPSPVPSSSSAVTPKPPRTRLFISGLSFRTTEESFRNAFQGFGQLVEVNLVMDKLANRPKGFAFLRYATEEQSQKAIDEMHGKFLDGRVIFVEFAKIEKRASGTPKP